MFLKESLLQQGGLFLDNRTCLKQMNFHKFPFDKVVMIILTIFPNVPTSKKGGL